MYYDATNIVRQQLQTKEKIPNFYIRGTDMFSKQFFLEATMRAELATILVAYFNKNINFIIYFKLKV